MQMRPLEVDTEILRGVPFHKALRQPSLLLWPSLYRHKPRAAELWKRSQKVDGFDFFISHTWRTPGRWKILSLLMQSGWAHGLLGGFFGVALILILECFEVIKPVGMGTMIVAGVEYTFPASPWVMIFGPICIILGVCASLLVPLRSQLCFLDMTSIHQSDLKLLERGIYSIGGFLSVSKELRVLYTPPYFTSLWCLFEMVAFRTSNPAGKMTFLPLFLERSVLVVTCCMWVLTFAQWSVTSLVDAEYRQQNMQYLSLFLIPMMMAMVHSTRQNYGEKRQLMDDLKCFQLDKVTCASDFDRAFIYRAIDSWYGSKDAFTKFVRGPLREELLDLLLSPHLPWTYAAFILSGPLTYRVQVGVSLFQAGAHAQPLLVYAMSSAAYIFGWLWPSFNGLFFLCDKMSTSGKTWCVSNFGKTLAVTLATFMCLFISEGLAIVVLRAQNLLVGIGFLVASMLLPCYIWCWKTRFRKPSAQSSQCLESESPNSPSSTIEI